MTRPKIAVVMGGDSAEREISRQTGAGVVAALDELMYPTVQLDFDERLADALREARPDAVFNALHGGTGEDGTLQAILDWLRIPYQGSGVRASAIAMDKWITKALARTLDIPVPRGVRLDVAAGEADRIPDMPGLPCVVKPAAQGSAVGVSIVHFAEQWADAVCEASSFGTAILVEEYIEGREFTVAVLDERALPVVEITPHDDFYTYHAKYTAGASTHVVPATIAEHLAQRMQEHALRLHRALGCRDYSRVDVLMSVTNSMYVLECNTLPGLTPLSLFPEAAAAAGIGYAALIERLVQAALSRGGVRAS
ncbi:MAG TPA: D-alanine--D-alanine ligase [Candidatus Eremiobacteraceae bacterium]|nr:D-alanine--D-alanine ligase [Candidatus Eremiobacteraceae bacterium]